MNKDYRDWYFKYQGYLNNPDSFSQEEIYDIRAKGQSFGIEIPDLSPGASIGSVMKNFGSGLVQGFSTIPFGSKPTNDIDGIAHSLGHLLGFIGVIPGAGTLTSVGLKSVGFGAKAARATKFAAKIAPGTKAAEGAAKFRSVPMYAADKFTGKFGKTAAADAVRNYFAKDWQRQAIRHGVHLGAASVVSETWDNLKEEDVLGFLTNSFMTGIQGGAFGAGFGIIGSKVKLPGSVTGMDTGDKVLRGVAGGLFQTLPGALQGATTPENVYNALLGAYFGGKAQPARYENAHRKLAKLDPVERAAYRNQEEFKNLGAKDKEATLDLLDNYYKLDQSSKGIWKAQDWLNKLFNIIPSKPSRESMAEYQGKKVRILEENPETKETLIQMPDGVTQETVSSRYVKKLTEIKSKSEIEKSIKEKVDTDTEINDIGEEITLSISKPIESFVRKLTQTEGRELTNEQYLITLNQLNRFMHKEISKERTKSDQSQTEQSVRSSQAKKFYDKHLAAIEKTDDPLKKLSALQRIKNRVAYDKSDTSDIESIIKPIEKELKSQGYEISDLKGQSYNTGKTLKVVQAVEDGTLKQGESIISQILKPQIMQDGKLVQAAEVVVRVGVRKLTAKEFKQEELKLEKEWAEKEKALNHLGSSKDTIASHKKAHDDYAKRVLKGLQVEAPPVKVPAAKKPVVKAPTKEAPTGTSVVAPWKTIRENLLKTFEHLKITQEEIGELKQFYVKQLNDKPILRYGWNAVTKQLEKQERYDYVNNRINDVHPPTLIDQLGKVMFGEDNSVMYVKNIWHSPLVKKSKWDKGLKKYVSVEEKGDPKQSKLGNFDFTAPENAGQYEALVNAAMKEGFYPYSGKSDSEVIIFVRKNVGKNVKSEYERIDKEITDGWGKHRKLGEKFNFRKEFNIISDQAQKKMGITKEQYKDMFVSNVRWWEMQNQRQIKDIAFDPNFIMDITDFNKRQQPIFSDYYPLTSESFPDGFKYIIVNDYANSKDPQIKALYKLIADRIELSDGAVLVRTDVNQGILSDHGLPLDGGFSKSFFVSPGKEGMLIGKHAMHDAGAEISKAMKELGIDFIIPKSVAKQHGSRNVIDWSFNKKDGTLGFSSKGKSLDFETQVKGTSVYSMKAEDVLGSFGVYDGYSAKLSDPVRVFKAIWDVMVDSEIMEIKNHKYKEGVFKEIKDWISNQALGEKEYNDMLNDYLAKGVKNDAVLSKLIKNFEKLGVTEVNNAFKENTIAAKAFREAGRKEIMDIFEVGMEKGEINFNAETAPIAEDLTATFQARKRSRGTDGNVLSKRLADDHSTQIAKYFLKKVIRPKVHSSGKAIMRSLDLELAQNEITKKLIENEELFFLDDGMKKKPIYGITKDSLIKPKWQTLGKRWDDLQAIDPKMPTHDQLSKVLTAAVVRTPMDNISALATLKFGGFTGRKGGGILLHPRVMERLGGADLDIDSANFYFNDSLPEVVKDLGALYSNELSRIKAHAKKNMGGMKKVEQEFLVEEGMKIPNSYLNMFDPYSRLLRANNIQQAASSMRGVAVNSRFTMKWLYQQAKANKGTFRFTVIKERDNAEGWTFEFKARDSEMDLKAKTTAAINMAVDIAKYNGRMVSREKLNSILLEAGFKQVRLISPKGKRYVVNPKNYELLWGKKGFKYKISATKDEKGVEIGFYETPAGALSNTMKHFFSRNFAEGRPWTHNEIREAAQQHPSEDTSHLSTVAEIFKSLDYHDSMLNRVIGNIDGFAKFGREINAELKNNPELIKYIQKDFAGVSLASNINRIKILSEYYVPFSHMEGYNAYYNIARPSGIKKLAHNKIDFLKFKLRLERKDLLFKNMKQYIDKNGELKDQRWNTVWKRENFIKRQIKIVNDFISNDLYDFASVKNTYDFGKIHNMPGRDADITNELYKLANNLKVEFKKVRKSANSDPALSATGTALDRVTRLIKEKIEPSLYKFVDAYNAGRRESAEPMTYQGIKEYFDSILYGSIKGKESQDYYFVETLVSDKVAQHHADIRSDMFNDAIEPRPIEKIKESLSNYPGNRIGNSAVEFESNVLKGMRYDGKKKLDKVELKDKEVIRLLDDIKNVISANKDGYFNEWSKSDIEQFFQGELRKRGIGRIEDADIYALRGIRNELVDWRKGRGFFRWFTRGGGRNLIKSLNEIGDDDKIRVAGNHFMKPTESTASDMYYNDIVSVSERFPVTMSNKEGKLVKLYAEAKVPMSHFEIMIKDVANMLDHPNQIRNMDENLLQKMFGQTSILDKNKGEAFDKFHDIVTRDIELTGAIKTKRDLEDSGARQEKIDNAERRIQQYMARRAEGEKLRRELEKEEFVYLGQRRKGSVVIDMMTERLQNVAEYIYNNKVRIQDDFGDMLLKNAFYDVKSVQVNNEKYDLIDFRLDAAIKKIIKPLTQEGYVPRPGQRQLSHDETMLFVYEQKLRRHAEDSIENGKPKKGTEYENDVARSLKQVRQLDAMKDVMLDENGNELPGFDFITKTVRSKAEIDSHIRTWFRLIREKMDELNYKKLEELSEQREKWELTPRWTKLNEARYQAHLKYFALKKAGVLDKGIYLEKFGQLRGYIETTGHQIPWKINSKTGEKIAYSQYDMDNLLALKKIDIPLYIKEKRRHDFMTMFRGTGRQEGYVPHMDFDPIKLGNDIVKKMEIIERSGMTTEQKTKAMENLANRRQKLLHETTLMDKNISEAVANSLLITDMSADVGVKQLELLGGDRKPGNVLGRRFNLDGYARDQGIWGRYTDALNQGTYNNLVGVLAEQTIRSFNKKNPMGKYTKDWEYFMRVYARDVVGAPSTVSKEILDSETMNIKNTPWWFMSDQAWYGSKAARKMAHLWTGKGKPDESVRRLFDYKKKTGQIREKDFESWWKKQKDLFETPYDEEGMPIKENIEFFSRRLKQVSMAEGKFAMATLLARAKTMVGNVFGGGTNNWVYTGSRNMWRARDIEVWRSINPNQDELKGPVFKTMNDVYKWAETQGVIEGIISYEIGLVGKARPTNYEAFVKDLTTMWKSDSITKVSMNELAKKHNISQGVVDKASWFMRKSERFLRLNTFLSGYLQIRESNHPIDFKLNDPYLINQAKKAVKAAQFFYHAPYRPPFARTSVGKVFSRFKLWAWNSVKFRRELYQEAKYRGFEINSREMERLQRLAMADMFVLGLANLLPYTMFDYSLPAPYSNMQDIADWAFGSDIQRDRAFYGALPHPIAPLHELMPSIFRGPEAIFGTIFTGAWDRLASYTLMSYVPFGLLSRDMYRSFQNPAMLMEFTTGIPIHQLGKAKKDIAANKKAPAYSPGFF